MKSCNNRKVKKWLTVIGCFLVALPVGIPFSWGNVGMYALSYIAVRGQDKTGVDTPWIASVFFTFDLCGMCFGGLAKKPRTRRLVLFPAVFLFAGGLCLTYMTVQMSVAALTLNVAVFCGFTGGILNGMALQCAGEWADKDLGLIIGFVQSGTQLWPVFVNPLLAIFVNPDNLSPSIEINSIRLFSQAEVLDKIPMSFIGIGLVSFILQFIGAVCVKDVTDLTPEETQLTSNGSGIHMEAVPKDTAVSGQHHGKDTKDTTVREMITSVSFYTVSAMYMLFECSLLVLINYYKDYGAVWINDDHFLANLGIPFVVCAALGYSVTGFVSDQIGLKKTVICMLSLSTWLSLLMYFTPMLDRWLYTINVLLLGFFLSPIFSLTAVSAGLLFGQANHMRNFFLVAIFGMVSDLVNPLALQALLTVGWFYVFLFGAAACTVSLIIVELTLPNI